MGKGNGNEAGDQAGWSDHTAETAKRARELSRTNPERHHAPHYQHNNSNNHNNETLLRSRRQSDTRRDNIASLRSLTTRPLTRGATSKHGNRARQRGEEHTRPLCAHSCPFAHQRPGSRGRWTRNQFCRRLCRPGGSSRGTPRHAPFARPPCIHGQLLTWARRVGWLWI